MMVEFLDWQLYIEQDGFVRSLFTQNSIGCPGWDTPPGVKLGDLIKQVIYSAAATF